MQPVPAWDRFGHWRCGPARAALGALLALLVATALVPIGSDRAGTGVGDADSVEGSETKRDSDLKLYEATVERIRKGENYYSFIVEQQRAAHYPVRPGFAVRLPTLAYLEAWLGDRGQIAAAVLLLTATMLAWWRRLGDEPGGRDKRGPAMAFLLVGISLGLNRHFFALHELWAGMLLALAFGLHRPGRWVASLGAAALAVAIRELALPFILLMAAMAFWRRDWKEGSAWTILAAVFGALLAVHFSIVASQVLPSDPTPPSWLQFRGLSGWLSNVVQSSNLRYLPHWLAGPVMIIMIFGWTGWKSAAGSFGTLLYLGYGLAFMIAGRSENYYWGAMVAPTMFVGLAFAPRAFTSLVRVSDLK
jgi:hypothetical protein